MGSIELKLLLTIITAGLIFAFMMYLQKKNDDKAEKIFQDTLKRIADKYDKLQEDNNEDSDLQSKTDKSSE